MTLKEVELRRLRFKAHKSFDRLWQRKLMTRSEAYRWLQKELDIPAASTHMLEMTSIAMLNKVIQVSNKFIGSSIVQEDFSSQAPLFRIIYAYKSH